MRSSDAQRERQHTLVVAFSACYTQAMKLELLSVGKPRQAGLSEAALDYVTRLKRYTRFEESNVREERSGRGAVAEDIVRKEGERILAKIGPGSYVVALDKSGKDVTSEALAKRVDQLTNTAADVVFVIGGAFGLDRAVISRANWTWSLSAQTYPHELVRVIVLEQLYRAHTILRGEPYHK